MISELALPWRGGALAGRRGVRRRRGERIGARAEAAAAERALEARDGCGEVILAAGRRKEGVQLLLVVLGSAASVIIGTASASTERARQRPIRSTRVTAGGGRVAADRGRTGSESKSLQTTRRVTGNAPFFRDCDSES